MRNYNKLPKSAMIREIVKIIALGLILACSGFALTFFLLMGSIFGYRDLNCRNYLETRRFADSTYQILNRINQEVKWTNEYVANTKEDFVIKDITYNKEQGKLCISSDYNVDLMTLAEDGDFDYDVDDYGISNVITVNTLLSDGETDYEEIRYDNKWYKIALSARSIESATDFCRISHDDYVNMFVDNATLNGETDRDFTSDCYIMYYKDSKVVYSPREDMFYSSIYGWYSVPNELFFLMDDNTILEGLELYFNCFTSLNDILRLHISGDYLEYVRAIKDINYNQRNIAYYVEHDGNVYGNVSSVSKIMSCSAYMVIQQTASGEYEAQLTNFENEYLNSAYVTSFMQELDRLTPDDKLYVGIYTTYPYYDVFSEGNQLFSEYYSYTLPALIVGMITAILALGMLLHILQNTGRASREDTNVYLTPIDRIPIEFVLILAFVELVVIVMLIATEDRFDYHAVFSMTNRDFVRLFVGLEGGYLLGCTWLLTFVRRAKAGCFWKQSLVRAGISFFKKAASAIVRQKNLVAKTIEYFLLYWLVTGVAIIQLVLAIRWRDEILLLISAVIFIAFNIFVIIMLVRKAKGEESIREATRALAEGNLAYTAPQIKRLHTEQVIIDNIDHLSDGLHEAIEKSLYDERMKTEMITNVSHDIKTPLTSIINYIDLIKREEVENEKVQHYLEVLDRKSQRLKQLTEDLVEVSRISSGNIELERVPIDLGELLRQAMGEFEDKFAEHNLKMVEKIPEEAHMIYADGRRTFRILDNLLQNVYKYAMPGTRVYMDLSCEAEIITLEIKNISQAPLNIEVSELMERFVRGDQSRTTEGSGLGLSIAQDLVKLQDGEFRLYLDGDLFKVVIRFPEYISPVVINAEEGGLISENTIMPIPEETDSRMEGNS